MSELPSVKDIQNIMTAAQEKCHRLQRADEFDEVSTFIADASLQECKLIADALIDRVATLTGCALELEEASCALDREIMGESTDEAVDMLSDAIGGNPMEVLSHLRVTGRGV